MPVDIDIAKVARLARIGLTDEELAAYGAQLEGILEHAAQVQALDTDDVEPSPYPRPIAVRPRPDVPIEPLAQRLC